MPILLFLLFLLAATPAHEYHISKTNLRYVAEQRQVQVEMHLFVDDLERAMMDAGAPQLDLGTKVEHERAAALLDNYLGRHFVIDWNGIPLPLETVGYEIEDDLHGFWIYLVADEQEPPSEVTVTNTLLTEFFEDQRNITKLFLGEDRLATLLTSRDRSSQTYSTK